MRDYYGEEDVFLKTRSDRGTAVFFKDGTYKYGIEGCDNMMAKADERNSSFGVVRSGCLYYCHGRKITADNIGNKWTDKGRLSDIYIENKMLEKIASIELEKAIFEE